MSPISRSATPATTTIPIDLPTDQHNQPNSSIKNSMSISEGIGKPLPADHEPEEFHGMEADKENEPRSKTGPALQAIEFETAESPYFTKEPRVGVESASADTPGIKHDNLDITNHSQLPAILSSSDRNENAVPEHLINKKYDTKPPRYVPRAQIIAAAERFYQLKRSYESAPSDADTDADTDLDCNYATGPVFKRQKQEKSSDSLPIKTRKLSTIQNETTAKQKAHLKEEETDSSKVTTSFGGKTTNISMKGQELGTARTVVNGRPMITISKPASTMQKLFTRFPAPNDPFPEDFTLHELCTCYPNHLFGKNLYPFLQHGWSAGKIANMLPDQNGVAEDDKVTANAIASRLRKVKLALQKAGRYNELMYGPKTHDETME